MTGKLEIRPSQPRDALHIEALYARAFPDEDLIPLVRDLLDLGENAISLLGSRENNILGHICFTICRIEGGNEPVALLGPLAVAPDAQKQGIGTALIETGFKHLKGAKIGQVFVLGDPAYYGRFGFKHEDNVATPYPIPTEWCDAWQSIQLSNGEVPLDGKLSVSEPWRDAALWSD